MNNERFEDLSTLLDHLWEYTIKGVRLNKNAMAAPAFATSGPRGPAVRTVVPRSVDRHKRTLDFHTDLRSPKVAHVRTNPRVAWMAWDKEQSQQFQFFGRATVHADDDVADSMWSDQSIDNLEFYFKSSPPGAALDSAGSGIDIYNVEEGEAREHFCVIRTVIDEIIWVHLHPEGEYRARFQFEDGRFKGRWIVP